MRKNSKKRRKIWCKAMVRKNVVVAWPDRDHDETLLFFSYFFNVINNKNIYYFSFSSSSRSRTFYFCVLCFDPGSQQQHPIIPKSDPRKYTAEGNYSCSTYVYLELSIFISSFQMWWRSWSCARTHIPWEHLSAHISSLPSSSSYLPYCGITSGSRSSSKPPPTTTPPPPPPPPTPSIDDLILDAVVIAGVIMVAGDVVLFASICCHSCFWLPFICASGVTIWNEEMYNIIVCVRILRYRIVHGVWIKERISIRTTISIWKHRGTNVLWCACVNNIQMNPFPLHYPRETARIV